MTEHDKQRAAIEAIKQQASTEFWNHQAVSPINTPFGMVDPRQARNRSLVERFGTLADIAAAGQYHKLR